MPQGDRRALRCFTRVLGGTPEQAADAWSWLAEPGAPGPSGADGPLTRLARSRRDLYRSGADAGAGDVADLETVLLAERAAARAAAARCARTSSRRGPLVLAAGLGALAVVGGLLSVGAGEPRSGGVASARAAGSSAPAAAAATAARSLRVTGAERSRLLALFVAEGAGEQRQPSLASRLQSAIDQSADSPFPADGRGARTISGIVSVRASGPSRMDLAPAVDGALTIGVVLSRPAPWRAVLVMRGGRRQVLSGTTVGGRLQYGLLIVPRSTAVESIDLDVPSDVDCAWQVLARG